jgi:hypothetical protein
MSKLFLSLSIAMMSWVGSIQAEETKESKESNSTGGASASKTESSKTKAIDKEVRGIEEKQSAKYKKSSKSNGKEKDESKKETHGFFHPFTKFWVHTVGGTLSHGMKTGAGKIRYGIGGGERKEKPDSDKK